ncbi:tripartite tricarboxylate transporter substrate binding protein [Curvibacter fontanus]|jgi:tripartite-type tricarboxylate transporter receptor subunit TctC
MKLSIAVAGALVACFASLSALAETWPTKAVTVIVPYVAGGGVDPVARLVSLKLAERWNQPVVVENRAGASGTIGANAVANAPADGNTILMSATAEVVINQHFMKKMAYDPEKDLRPVTLLVKLPFALVTNPSKPYNDMASFLSYVRQNPGKVSYASSGSGTPQHLAGVLVEQLANVSMLHVPFKGVAQAMTDILSGQVDVGFAGLPTALQQVKAGKVRALGVSSRSPAPAAPQIPPLAKTSVLEKFELIQWFGVFVPSKTPDSVVSKIQNDISEVLALPEVRDTLLKQGAEPSGMSTPDFENFVKDEREKFRKIVQTAKIEQ